MADHCRHNSPSPSPNHGHELHPAQAAPACCGHGHAHAQPHSHPPEHPPAHPPEVPPAQGTQAAVAAAPLRPDGDAVQSRLRILQMDCPTEEALIRQQLGAMPAVQALEFNLMQRVLTVNHAPGALEPVQAALRSLGFEAELIGAHGSARSEGGARREASAPAADQPNWWPLALAGLAAAGSEALAWLGWMGLPAWPGAGSAALALLAVAICGAGTYRKGWVAIRHGQLNINALMSLAVSGALALGQWPEAAMVMVLFTLAERIEARSLDRARHAISGLLALTPETASVQQPDGRWQPQALSAIAVGSMLRVKPGERLGLDGQIIAGHSSLNQAPITGESLPVDKQVGDTVYAGTINLSGSFDYRSSAAADQSSLARIIHAVEAAQGSKAPTQRFVDQFARIYTPAVVAIAVLVALLPPLLGLGGWHEWIYRALVLLVISCPCALVISTPVTVVSGLTAAARQGILIKGGAFLEQGRRLVWLALDKTGTLTHGQPVQTEFEALAGLEAAHCRRLAASLASRSDHPVSQALAQAAEREGIAASPVEAFEALPGRGVRGQIEGHNYALGNHRLAHEQGRCTPALEARLEALERQGRSVALLMDEQGVLALFAVADTLKPHSAEAIAELHQLGVKTLLLSGDNQHTSSAIASQVGIHQALGNQLPQDKLQAIERLQAQGPVGMVGDGINDAPALARAEIGFAMAAIGSATAIETADVALMDDDLRKLPRFIRLSRATHAVLVQNIVLALGIKAVFLGLTLAGLGSMWMAVFADVGASLLVVANGLRLLRR